MLKNSLTRSKLDGYSTTSAVGLLNNNDDMSEVDENDACDRSLHGFYDG